jgi:hypothetical protein
VFTYQIYLLAVSLQIIAPRIKVEYKYLCCIFKCKVKCTVIDFVLIYSQVAGKSVYVLDIFIYS